MWLIIILFTCTSFQVRKCVMGVVLGIIIILMHTFIPASFNPQSVYLKSHATAWFSTNSSDDELSMNTTTYWYGLHWDRSNIAMVRALNSTNDSQDISPLNASMYPWDRQKDITNMVPNVVHYVWFAYKGRKSILSFLYYLGIVSTHKSIKPDRIYFHTDKPPTGYYWDLLANIPEFEVVLRKPTRKLFGKRLKTDAFDTTASNLDRLLVLKEHGGIYLDLDVIAIRSFAPILQYDVTLGTEGKNKICDGVIVSKPGADFLDLWIDGYVNDSQPNRWAYNSGQVSSGHIEILILILMCIVMHS